MGKKLKWNLVLMSLLYLGLGIFLLLVPGTALNIVCYALGGVVLACAAVQLIRYFAVERGVFQSQLTLISGLVCLGLGAFLIIRSDIVVRILPIGVILIVEGSLNLLSALYTVIAVKRFLKLHPETQSMLEAVTGEDLNGDGVIAPDVAPADVEASAVELDHVDESAEVEQENEE